MREILFRGKRIDTGEWVYGYYSRHKSGKTFIRPLGGSCLTSCEVVPLTISQYTGLTDKNGKRIFEGDILSIAQESDGMGDYFYPPIKYPSNALVKWDKCSWMWEIIAKQRYYLTFPKAWCHFECEVIGNATDNPELLEVGE